MDKKLKGILALTLVAFICASLLYFVTYITGGIA